MQFFLKRVTQTIYFECDHSLRIQSRARLCKQWKWSPFLNSSQFIVTPHEKKNVLKQTVQIVRTDSPYIYIYIPFEITGDLCNLIGSQQCDLFPNHTIFCSKSHHLCSKARHFHFKSHHMIFAHIAPFLLRVQNEMQKPFCSTFNKPAIWSNKYWYRLNSAISKWL